MSRRARALSLVAATLAGMVIGVAGGFVQAHRSVWLFDGRYLVIPWGVLIVVAVLLVSIRGAALVIRMRSASWLVLGGWLATTLFLATETPWGDIAVSSGARQWGYLLSGAIIGSAIATLPPRSLASLRAMPEDAGRAEEPSGLV